MFKWLLKVVKIAFRPTKTTQTSVSTVPCVIVFNPIDFHLHLPHHFPLAWTRQGPTGARLLTYISLNSLQTLGGGSSKKDGDAMTIYTEVILCSESAPTHLCGRGMFMWGDEEMEIVSFWPGKPCFRSFQRTGGLSWPMRVDCQPPTWWLGLCVGGRGGEDTAAFQPCLRGCMCRHTLTFIYMRRALIPFYSI